MSMEKFERFEITESDHIAELRQKMARIFNDLGRAEEVFHNFAKKNIGKRVEGAASQEWAHHVKTYMQCYADYKGIEIILIDSKDIMSEVQASYERVTKFLNSVGSTIISMNDINNKNDAAA